GCGCAALVIVRVSLAQSELHSRLQGAWRSHEPSSDLVKARPSTRLSAVGMTRPTGETDSTPAKADPSLIATAAVEAGVPIGLSRSEERRVGKGWSSGGTGRGCVGE